MKCLPLQMLLASVLTGGLICCETTQAQEADTRAVGRQGEGAAAFTPKLASDKEWYYGPTSQQAEPKTLGRQRAEFRAQQRLARMESMRWYGFSASRPTAAGMPFTTMYSPAWTRSGGRLFTEYTRQRPVVIVSPCYPSWYYR